MRKNVFGRRFKRDTNERKSLFKSLISALVLRERITTTHAKAKAVRGQAEKLVTKARKGVVDNAVFDRFLVPQAKKKLLADIATRFDRRPGGYTRIVKLGRRITDAAPMAIMEWVEKSSKLKVQNTKLKDKKKEVVEEEIATERPLKTAKAIKKRIVKKKETKK